MGREEGKKWELVYTTSTCVTVSLHLLYWIDFRISGLGYCYMSAYNGCTNTLASAAIATSVVKIL